MERRSASWTTVLCTCAVSLIGGLACLWLTFHYGQQLPASDRAAVAATVGQGNSFWQAIFNELRRSFYSPVSSFILQIVTILIAARVCGMLLRHLGQPRVVGEIIAGILLGPSLLKAVFPEFHAVLFPESSLPSLFFLATIGLLLFMFTIGLELDLKSLASWAKSAVLISHMSIVLLFVLGTGLALLLFADYAPHQHGFVSFALFMGVSMSITAFPVLARIIQETNLIRTTLGAAAITCAAVDDVTAWCILAVIVGIVQSGSAPSAAGVIGLAMPIPRLPYSSSVQHSRAGCRSHPPGRNASRIAH